MINISKFLIPHIFIDLIKKQALSSEDEIYGWLIGYEDNNVPNVLAIIECKNFEQQTLISAIPQAQEFQKISSVMPQGIGPIGIYHSHPFSSKIFHSHTDDSTLRSLSNQFSNCISIITNGEEINFYKMGKNKETCKMNVEYKQPDILEFLLFTINENLTLKISKEFLLKLKEKGNLKIKIFNLLIDHFEKIWDKMEFYSSNRVISLGFKIKDYLNYKSINQSIEIKIPKNQKNLSNNLVIIENNVEINNREIQKEFKSFNLKLKVTIPIYITDKSKSFRALDEIIRTEILSNNIANKLYDSIIDLKNQEILLPEDHLLHYYNFLIRISCFKEKSLNTNSISKNIFEFINNILTTLKFYEDIQLDNLTKKSISLLIQDIEKISKFFEWKNKIIKMLKSIEKQLNSTKS